MEAYICTSGTRANLTWLDLSERSRVNENKCRNRSESHNFIKNHVEGQLYKQLVEEYNYGGRERVLTVLRSLKTTNRQNLREVEEMKTTPSQTVWPVRLMNEKFRDAVEQMIEENNAMHEEGSERYIPVVDREIMCELFTVEKDMSARAMKERDLENNDPIFKLLKTCLSRKDLHDLICHDPESFAANENTIMNNIRSYLAEFPVASMDREYHAGFDQTSFLTKRGIVTYLWRLSAPFKVPDLLRSPHVTIVGDFSTMKGQIGIIPENSIDLSAYVLDMPCPQGVDSKHWTGQLTRTRVFLGILIDKMKQKMKNGKHNKENLERWYGAIFKLFGVQTDATWAYIGIDTLLDLLQLLVIMCYKSTLLIRNWVSWERQDQ